MDEEEHAARPMNRLKNNGPPQPNMSMIHAFGDSETFLSYNIEEQLWTANKFDNNSNYNGSLKYMSAVSMQDAKIFLTGGCLISTGDATNTCYEVSGLSAGKN